MRWQRAPRSRHGTGVSSTSDSAEHDAHAPQLPGLPLCGRQVCTDSYEARSPILLRACDVLKREIMMRSALCLFDEGMEASTLLYCQLYEGLPQFPGSNHVSLTSFDGAIATVLRLKYHVFSFS